MAELNIEADRAHILSQGLCKQLIARFHRRRRAGQSEGAILHELLHEIYAQGFAAARRATPPSPSTTETLAALEDLSKGAEVAKSVEWVNDRASVVLAALASRPAVEAGESIVNFTVPEGFLLVGPGEIRGAFERFSRRANRTAEKLGTILDQDLESARLRATLAPSRLPKSNPCSSTPTRRNNMSNIAKIGSTEYPTVAAAADALQDGQTLQILRSGSGAECLATFNKPGTFKVMGVVDSAGNRPKMQLDAGTRLSWGKAIHNVEQGNIEFGYIDYDGAVIAPDSNGAAIRMNPGAGIIKVHHFKITGCENGILTSEGPGELYLSDGVIDKCGLSSDPARQGYSHNIYVGAIKRFQALRVSFTNSVYGHDIKTRALVTVLMQVLAQGSAKGRALDVPNGGALIVKDSKLGKAADAGQSNLIDIGAEGINGREEEYTFTNTWLVSDIPADRDGQYINNRSSKSAKMYDTDFDGVLAAKSRAVTVIGAAVSGSGTPFPGPRIYFGGNPAGIEAEFVASPLPAVTAPVATTPSTGSTTTPAASGAMTISLTPELMALAAKLVAPPAIPAPSPVDSLGTEFANMVADALSDRTRKSTITVTITPDGIATKVTHPK